MHKIEYLQNKFKHLSEQGTDDWLDGRKYAFGGSEIATVRNLNPYGTFEELVHRKIHRINDIKDITEWGKLFEPVAKRFISTDTRSTIYEFGSIPSANFPVCYSPDGIIVMDDNLRLLEIKSPIYRGIKSIPEYYLHQVQTGMDILPVKDTLFAQFRFRRCPLYSDPYDSKYDRFYHKEFAKRAPHKLPEAYGYLWWDDECNLTDLGLCDNICNAKPRRKADRILVNTKLTENKGFALMWKLFDREYTTIDKIDNYLKEIEVLLWTKYKEMRVPLNAIKNQVILPEQEHMSSKSEP